jgi:hypothetical protein
LQDTKAERVAGPFRWLLGVVLAVAFTIGRGATASRESFDGEGRRT